MAAPAFRAVLADTVEAASTAGTDHTQSITVAAGDSLLVAVSFRDSGDTNQTVSSVVFNGSENLVKLGESNSTAGSTAARSTSLWGLLAPTATTANIVATFSESVLSCSLVVVAYTGVFSFGAVSAGDVNNNNASVANGRLAMATDLVTTRADSLAVASMVCQRGTTAHSPFTPDNGTDRADKTTGANATNDLAIEFVERAAPTIGSYAFGSNTNDAASSPVGGAAIAVELQSAPTAARAMHQYLGLRGLGLGV